MAKKRASSKPKMNQPPIGDDEELRRQTNRRTNLQNMLSANLKPGNKPGEVSRLSNEERRFARMQVRAINAAETAYLKNQVKYPSRGVTPMSKAQDAPLRGRTVEYGTRSMLQGLRNWIAGGGGSRLTGR